MKIHLKTEKKIIIVMLILVGCKGQPGSQLKQGKQDSINSTMQHEFDSTNSVRQVKYDSLIRLSLKIEDADSIKKAYLDSMIEEDTK